MFDFLKKDSTKEKAVYTDAEIEVLWEQLEDVPMNPKTECLDADFFIFEKGTQVLDIWHWFDERYSKGVYELLYNFGR